VDVIIGISSRLGWMPSGVLHVFMRATAQATGSTRTDRPLTLNGRCWTFVSYTRFGAMPVRFIENGPDIPNDLLVARDDGDVLFFCGAGVSRAKAGLADFLTLAGDVIEDLGSLTGSQARRLHDAASTTLPSGAKSYVPVDRMFSSLDLEFDAVEVRNAVARALKPTASVNLEAHRILIDLSRGSDGRPRLITTNFDLLFEACDDLLGSSGPPRLPLPDRPADFEGIIHLHGRTNADYTGISNDAVVLSSSDFGKAYLSDGWATHYIRRLMNRFKIVFVGYSADDPPVQYLLEALKEEQSPIENIYAFQYGDELDAQELWMQKGVVPIAFGNNYDNLWDTLKGWAERARDPDAWYQKTIDAASTGPSNAAPLLRGQIAHMASTPEGMTKLTTSKPPLPSTWLYAFDPAIRYLKPGRVDRFDPNSPEIDPFEHLGLDGDEPPPPIDQDDLDQDRKVPTSAWNAFVTTRRDLAGATEREVGSIFAQSLMLPRFEKLSNLLLDRMTEAPALWWAAGQSALHPALAHAYEHHLRYRLRDDGGKILRYWRLLLRSWKEPKFDVSQIELEIQHRASRDGWSAALVREAVDIYRPRLTVERDFGAAPPMALDADPEKYIKLDVEYPGHHTDFDFGTTFLPAAVAATRAMLVLSEQMENEIGAWLSVETIRTDGGKKLSSRAYGLTGPVISYIQLVEALISADPEAARKEVVAWNAHDGIVFDRLRIWAAGRPELTSINEAEAVFASLSDRTFWFSSHQRDLLLSIRDRWFELTTEGKRSIETRLLVSSVPYGDDLDADQVVERRAIQRLNLIHWFTTNGVNFGFDLEVERARLLQDVPSWQPEYAEHVGQPRMSGVYSVRTDTDPTSILHIPVHRLLPIAVPSRSFRDPTELDPFAGYSSTKPARAVMALHSGMKRHLDTVPHYWSTFLRSTSKVQTSSRLNSVVIKLIDALPADDIAKLWYPLVEWLAPRAAVLETRGLGEFDVVWEKVLTAASMHPSGYKQKPGRDWSFESINSVLGRLVEVLLGMDLPSGQLTPPANWISRLTKALNVPGDHGRHALDIVAQQTPWLYAHEPAWTEMHLLAKASSTGPDSDAFWSGFATLAHVPDDALLQRLKDPMLNRVGKGGRHEDNLIGFLLSGWGNPAPDQMVTDAELRDVLILGDDPLRSTILRFVSDWTEQDQKWKGLIVPFLMKVWPRQRTVRTPAMSSALFSFASSQPEQFANIIEVVCGRLVPLSRNDNMYLECNVGDLDAAGVDALLTALELLLPEERSEWPYQGKQIIQSLIDADVGRGDRLDELAARAAERSY